MTNPTEDGRQDCMVERVARALFGSWVANWGHIGEPECTNWDELDAHGREFGLKQARDAIESMRIPTGAMLEEFSQVLAAAREGFWHPRDTEETLALYRRLIDAAFGVSPNPTEERGGE